MINEILIGLCCGLGFYIGIFIYEYHIRHWFIENDHENEKIDSSEESL